MELGTEGLCHPKKIHILTNAFPFCVPVGVLVNPTGLLEGKYLNIKRQE